MEIAALLFSLLHIGTPGVTALDLEADAARHIPCLASNENDVIENYEDDPEEVEEHPIPFSTKYDRPSNPITAPAVTLTEFFEYGMVHVESGEDGIAVVSAPNKSDSDKFKTYYTKKIVPEIMAIDSSGNDKESEDDNDEDDNLTDEEDDLSKLASRNS